MKFLTAVLSSIYLSIGYTGLLPAHLKLKTYMLLISFLFPIYYWFDTYFGQWLTIPLVAGCSLIIYLVYHRNLLVLTLALTGHLMLILINHTFTIPLSMIGKSIPYLYEYHEVTIILILAFCTFIVLRLLRRFFILPKLPVLSVCPKKLLGFFLAELYIGLALMTANFIYGESVSYPTQILSFNGMLVTIFALSTILIFYNMYDILKKNHELSLQQAQAAVMHDYAHRMESLYEDIRVFRHDYRNILSTMQQYIDRGDTEALREYFHKVILNSASVLSDDGFRLGRLHRLEDDAVKSLLYTKIMTILNLGIHFELEITEPVPALTMDSLTLCRILGILLDNAMEAAADSPDKKLCIAIATTDASVLFGITNSTRPLPVPVSILLDRGYSTKTGHEGLGLSTVAQLLEPIPYANLYIECDDGITFRQTLEIQKQP